MYREWRGEYPYWYGELSKFCEAISFLFQGSYFAWKATAMGKNYVNGKTFLEKRYNIYLVYSVI